jgi:hypothetical protein
MADMVIKARQYKEAKKAGRELEDSDDEEKKVEIPVKNIAETMKVAKQAQAQAQAQAHAQAQAQAAAAAAAAAQQAQRPSVTAQAHPPVPTV